MRPLLSSSSAAAICFSVAIRRAARMSLMSGAVLANSKAVAGPIPDEAPVISTVLSVRRAPDADSDILRRCAGAGAGAGAGLLRVRVRATKQWSMRRKDNRLDMICITAHGVDAMTYAWWGGLRPSFGPWAFRSCDKRG